MSRHSLARLSVVVIITLVVLTTIGRFNGHNNAWEQRAQQAEQLAARQLARADSAERAAKISAARADSLASVARHTQAQVRQRVEVINREVIPDTCATFVAERDSLVQQALASADQWEGAYQNSLGAVDALMQANGALHVANDSLLSVVRSRPRPRSRLLPRVGPYLGVGAGKGGVGLQAGVGFAWEF